MITAKLKWLGARLEARAKDARQAEQTARNYDPSAYPYAHRLADVHAEAAAVYERAVGEALKELRLP